MGVFSSIGDRISKGVQGLVLFMEMDLLQKELREALDKIHTLSEELQAARDLNARLHRRVQKDESIVQESTRLRRALNRVTDQYVKQYRKLLARKAREHTEIWEAIKDSLQPPPADWPTVPERIRRLTAERDELKKRFEGISSEQRWGVWYIDADNWSSITPVDGFDSVERAYNELQRMYCSSKKHQIRPFRKVTNEESR